MSTKRLDDLLKVLSMRLGRGNDRAKQIKQAVLGSLFGVHRRIDAHSVFAHDDLASRDALVANVHPSRAINITVTQASR